MNESKRIEKEHKIITAAEKVFESVGFKNAKMEDIAAEAGITKVTLYSYFQSKENLYLAITHRGMVKLIDIYYATLDKNKNKAGLESVIDIFRAFAQFCHDNFLYSETLMDYFSLIRSTNDGTNLLKLTEATKESIYYLKLQDIQNLPFKMTAKEIARGQRDGSIRKGFDPMLYTVFGWTTVVGFVKVVSVGKGAKPLFGIDSHELRDLILKTVGSALV